MSRTPIANALNAYATMYTCPGFLLPNGTRIGCPKLLSKNHFCVTCESVTEVDGSQPTPEYVNPDGEK